MKTLIPVIITILLLTSCNGGGDGAPQEIAGSWYGSGYISGNLVWITVTFHPLNAGYYEVHHVFDGYGYQHHVWIYDVYYENGWIYSPNGKYAEVKSDCILYPQGIDIGGAGSTGTITLYKQ